MRIYQRTILIVISSLFWSMLHSSCRKLIAIPAPVNTITTTQVFSTETKANAAMAGVYSVMINGDKMFNTLLVGQSFFSAGLVTIMGGLSSGEMYNYAGSDEQALYVLSTNKLGIYQAEKANMAWETAYKTIYAANSVIEGIAASTALALRDSTRKALTGEAKFVRAFSYFYLTNLFGDVPLALTVDFNQTRNMPRTPQQQVYQQIVADLKDAEANMPESYPTSNGERVRPNKATATALLARVYLYLGEYVNAVAAATTLIDNTAAYGLETDLTHVFLKESREAIWQLKQTTTDASLKNATPEGYQFLPLVFITGSSNFVLSDQLLKVFEEGDQRYVAWTDSTNNSNATGTFPGITHYPSKYKIGSGNGAFGADAKEYYVVFRLAEMYLVRAEAAANGGPGGTATAIADLNVIRHRAGLGDLPANLTAVQVKAAVAKERQTELFAEWGHRWFDLKRTGMAHDVLSAMQLKQPWLGDYQLLYPIPVSEIIANHFLTQNPGY
ncbi:RagB/SusD family nutrient uptake outer membrane protein [Chitinophaga sp. CC14]|uniref:RagB/SusD family nutrient uptake outer membrane protein n=1 Tax=Chitinophaga sp. CC14 TaxID=3029199 RepID=UPI003B776869